MFLLRWVATSLCATAMVLFVLTGSNPFQATLAPPSSICEAGPRVNVIDVAAGTGPGQLARLVRLEPGEIVVAINDQPLPNDFVEAGALIASLAPRSGGYLDLTVSSARGERRVLILLH